MVGLCCLNCGAELEDTTTGYLFTNDMFCTKSCRKKFDKELRR